LVDVCKYKSLEKKDENSPLSLEIFKFKKFLSGKSLSSEKPFKLDFSIKFKNKEYLL